MGRIYFEIRDQINGFQHVDSDWQLTLAAPSGDADGIAHHNSKFIASNYFYFHFVRRTHFARRTLHYCT